MTWDKVNGAKSYVIHYGVKGSAADRMHYTETNSFTLNDVIFNGTLAGVQLDVYVQTFNEVFDGSTEIEQAENANIHGHGSEWSIKLEINFPTVGD